jgi:uncharacterized membrane protein YdbT with pleckstrin-like domain
MGLFSIIGALVLVFQIAMIFILNKDDKKDPTLLFILIIMAVWTAIATVKLFGWKIGLML